MARSWLEPTAEIDHHREPRIGRRTALPFGASLARTRSVALSSEGAARWAAGLRDDRSRRVVFVSHCLLNQNVRYLGGASFAGVVHPAVDQFLRDGTGVVQMPCPEQIAWGGVMKPLLMRVYGSQETLLFRLRRLLVPGFLAYTRRRYRGLARAIANDIEDYVSSGYEVVGVIGVGDSPSCGVTHTLDVRRALPIVASLDVNTVDRATFNERVVRACLVEGRGLFVEALQHELTRKGLRIPFLEHDPLSSGSA